jgi:hypothetical protein
MGAAAAAVNMVVTAPAGGGNCRLYADATAPPPLVSNINFAAGQTRGNNAIVRLGIDGTITVLCAGSSSQHFILDVSGYFQ